jgi:GR25 family glycosyltransferase involved in LPS biosynthesis
MEEKKEITVINLDDRVNRWKETQKIFSKFDNIKLNRFSAIKMVPGWKGCANSHIQIISNAKDEKRKYVIVMEDDIALFDPLNFQTKFDNIISFLDKSLDKWDIFQFGVTYSSVGNNNNVHWVNKDLNIIEYQFGLTASFIIYNESVYDKMINTKNNLVRERNDTNDVVINSFNFKQWTVIPFLAYQRDGYSDIQNRKMSYRHHFVRNEKYLKDKLK